MKNLTQIELEKLAFEIQKKIDFVEESDDNLLLMQKYTYHLDIILMLQKIKNLILSLKTLETNYNNLYNLGEPGENMAKLIMENLGKSGETTLEYENLYFEVQTLIKRIEVGINKQMQSLKLDDSFSQFLVSSNTEFDEDEDDDNLVSL